jgi:hypothetical protein
VVDGWGGRRQTGIEGRGLRHHFHLAQPHPLLSSKQMIARRAGERCGIMAQRGNETPSAWLRSCHTISGMAQSIIIHALTEKRAEISGRIHDLEERTRQARADLAHIDAAMLLFDPDAKPAAIRAKLPSKGRSSLFANGEISRRCREAIRDANGEPVAAEAIVRQAIADKGFESEDKALRQDLVRRFLWALHRMQIAGTVQRVGKGLGARWALPNGAEGE